LSKFTLSSIKTIIINMDAQNSKIAMAAGGAVLVSALVGYMAFGSKKETSGGAPTSDNMISQSSSAEDKATRGEELVKQAC
jgi:hypothetical protein